MAFSEAEVVDFVVGSVLIGIFAEGKEREWTIARVHPTPRQGIRSFDFRLGSRYLRDYSYVPGRGFMNEDGSPDPDLNDPKARVKSSGVQPA